MTPLCLKKKIHHLIFINNERGIYMYKIIKSALHVYNKPLQEYSRLSVASTDKVVKHDDKYLSDILASSSVIKPVSTVSTNVNLNKLFGNDLDI